MEKEEESMHTRKRKGERRKLWDDPQKGREGYPSFSSPSAPDAKAL